MGGNVNQHTYTIGGASSHWTSWRTFSGNWLYPGLNIHYVYFIHCLIIMCPIRRPFCHEYVYILWFYIIAGSWKKPPIKDVYQKTRGLHSTCFPKHTWLRRAQGWRWVGNHPCWAISLEARPLHCSLARGHSKLGGLPISLEVQGP